MLRMLATNVVVLHKTIHFGIQDPRHPLMLPIRNLRWQIGMLLPSTPAQHVSLLAQALVHPTQPQPQMFQIPAQAPVLQQLVNTPRT